MLNSKRDDIFTLLDTRGVGTLTLDAIVEFVDTLPRPPSHALITKLFKESDKDGSGDIDSTEFGALLEAIGKAVGLSFDALVTYFTDAQYLKLFELVDTDGGGTISRDELKQLVESLQAMLKLKASTADVGVMFRTIGKTELNLDDFTTLMKKIAGDRPVSHIVRAFEEAQHRTTAVMQSAIQHFDPNRQLRSLSPGKQRPQLVQTAGSKCLNCSKKETELDRLRSRILELEHELELANTVRDRTPSPIIASSFAQPQEKLSEALKQVAVAYEENKESQMVIFSAEVHAKAARIMSLLSFERKTANFAAGFEQAHKAGVLAQSVVSTLLEKVRPLIAARKEYLAIHEIASIEDVEDLYGKIEALKKAARAHDEELRWATDNVVTSRGNVAQIALSSLPLVPNSKNLQEATQHAEEATIAFVEFVARLSVTYTGNSSADVWLSRGKRLSPEEIERIKSQLCEDVISKEMIHDLFQQMTSTTHAVNAIVSMTTVRVKDRSIQAVLVDDLSFETRELNSTAASRQPIHLHEGNNGTMITPHSRAPRARSKKRQVDKSTQKYVDSLLKHYLQLGLKVPTNFGRVPQLLPTRHVFYFGSKKIDLSVVEDSLAVAVGGGFLMLDEFCCKFTHLEQARLERILSGNVVGNTNTSNSVAGSMSPTRPGTSRSISLRSPSDR